MRPVVRVAVVVFADSASYLTEIQIFSTASLLQVIPVIPGSSLKNLAHHLQSDVTVFADSTPYLTTIQILVA